MQREIRSVRLYYDPSSRTYGGHPRAEEVMQAYEVIVTAQNNSAALYDTKMIIWKWQLDTFGVLLAEWCEHANRNASCERCTSPPCCPFCDSPLTQVEVRTHTERDQHGTLTMLQFSILQMLAYVYKPQIHVLRCCTEESTQAECTCQQESPFQDLTNERESGR